MLSSSSGAWHIPGNATVATRVAHVLSAVQQRTSQSSGDAMGGHALSPHISSSMTDVSHASPPPAPAEPVVPVVALVVLDPPIVVPVVLEPPVVLLDSPPLSSSPPPQPISAIATKNLITESRIAIHLADFRFQEMPFQSGKSPLC
jgi:hypothetical protein